MEKNIEVIRVHGKKVIGCVKFNKDVMVSVSFENESGVSDFFLTQEQAIEFRNSLNIVIDSNENKHFKGKNCKFYTIGFSDCFHIKNSMALCNRNNCPLIGENNE